MSGFGGFINLPDLVLENMTEWVTVMNTHGRIQYTNPAIEDVLGFTPEEVTNKSPAQTYWPRTDTEVRPRTIWLETHSKGYWRGIVANRTKGGKMVRLAVQTSLLKDADDKVTGLILVARRTGVSGDTKMPISGREGGHFHEIAELLPNPVCEVSKDLKATYVNKVGLETFGLTVDDVRMGLSVLQLIHPGDREEAAAGIQKVLRGESTSNEHRMLGRDGATLHMLINAVPMYKEGEVVGMRNVLTDVSGHKRTERELELSEERHRMLVEAMNDGLGVQDEEGVLTYVNKRLADMFGYTPEELVGRRTSELVHDSYRDKFFKEVSKRKERDRTPYEMAFTHKNGQPVPTIMSPAPLIDADGAFRGSFAVLTDITERKVSEDALEKERNLLRTLMNSLPDYVYVKDTEGRYITANTAHLRALGVAGDLDIVGKTDFDFLPKEQAEEAYAAEQDFMKSGQRIESDEIRVKDRFGDKVRWFHAVKVPLRSLTGDTIGVVGVLRDVTERKNAIEALRESEERFRMILENSRDVAFKINAHTHQYEYISPCVEELIGLKPRDILALRSDEFETRVHPEDADKLKEHRRKQLESTPVSDVPHIIEYRFQGRGDDYRTFAESSTLVYDDQGELEAIVGTLRDMTDQRQAEAGLREASRMEATATLAGGIAHDFNNLMVGVLGNAELLQMKLEDRPDVHRQLNNIAKSAQQAGDLAQKMLAFARGGKYQPKILNLNDTVRETLQLEEHSFPPNVRIERDLEPELWLVKGDPNQMSQVVMNLSLNAVEAIEGNGRISIITRNLEIDEDFAKMHPGLKAGSFAYLCVEDTGKGMAADVKSKVFEPFFTTKFQGRGLGLAAVYGIIRNHDGFISVYSEEGIGSSFKVYLPAIVAKDEARKRETSLDSLQSAANETVMLVDDEEVVVDVTKELLERLGYKVIVANNGKEAIRMAQTYNEQIHLAILDMGMPVMGGAEAYPWLKQTRPEMKVVICSGYELGEAAQKLLDDGANGFVQKPYRADRIATAVRQALDT